MTDTRITSDGSHLLESFSGVTVPEIKLDTSVAPKVTISCANSSCSNDASGADIECASIGPDTSTYTGVPLLSEEETKRSSLDDHVAGKHGLESRNESLDGGAAVGWDGIEHENPPPCDDCPKAKKPKCEQSGGTATGASMSDNQQTVPEVQHEAFIASKDTIDCAGSSSSLMIDSELDINDKQSSIGGSNTADVTSMSAGADSSTHSVDILIREEESKGSSMEGQSAGKHGLESNEGKSEGGSAAGERGENESTSVETRLEHADPPPHGTCSKAKKPKREKSRGTSTGTRRSPRQVELQEEMMITAMKNEIQNGANAVCVRHTSVEIETLTDIIWQYIENNTSWLDPGYDFSKTKKWNGLVNRNSNDDELEYACEGRRLMLNYEDLPEDLKFSIDALAGVLTRVLRLACGVEVEGEEGPALVSGGIIASVPRIADDESEDPSPVAPQSFHRDDIDFGPRENEPWIAILPLTPNDDSGCEKSGYSASIPYLPGAIHVDPKVKSMSFAECKKLEATAKLLLGRRGEPMFLKLSTFHGGGPYSRLNFRVHFYSAYGKAIGGVRPPVTAKQGWLRHAAAHSLK